MYTKKEIQELKFASKLMSNILEQQFPGIGKAARTENGFDRLDFLTDIFRHKISERVDAVFRRAHIAGLMPEPQETPEERQRLMALLAEIKGSAK